MAHFCTVFVIFPEWGEKKREKQGLLSYLKVVILTNFLRKIYNYFKMFLAQESKQVVIIFNTIMLH